MNLESMNHMNLWYKECKSIKIYWNMDDYVNLKCENKNHYIKMFFVTYPHIQSYYCRIFKNLKVDKIDLYRAIYFEDT